MFLTLSGPVMSRLCCQDCVDDCCVVQTARGEVRQSAWRLEQTTENCECLWQHSAI